MILGDSSLVGGLDVGGAPASASPSASLSQAWTGVQVPESTPVDQPVFSGPADVWGLISIPTNPAPEGEAQGDPGLWIYLQFLKAYIQKDAGATALWSALGMAPGFPVVNAIRAYEPGDDEDQPGGHGLTSKDLPALYMWRKGGGDTTSVEYIAEDWLVSTSEVRLLWVFPLEANNANQRRRASFVDALAKVITVAIERGRTPSFVVPGDPDPNALTIGSFVHTFTGVMAFNVTRWGGSRVRLQMIGERGDAASAILIPALEMRFELQENLIKDTTLWSFPSALQQTVTEGQPQAATWGAATQYGAGAYLVAQPIGSLTSFIYQASGAGISGISAPTWPITTGATVVDGSITWTCQGKAGPPFAVLGRA
jgi:hypothetical protein